jgi:hypothetical protein
MAAIAMNLSPSISGIKVPLLVTRLNEFSVNLCNLSSRENRRYVPIVFACVAPYAAPASLDARFFRNRPSPPLPDQASRRIALETSVVVPGVVSTEVALSCERRKVSRAWGHAQESLHARQLNLKSRIGSRLTMVPNCAQRSLLSVWKRARFRRTVGNTRSMPPGVPRST